MDSMLKLNQCQCLSLEEFFKGVKQGFSKQSDDLMNRDKIDGALSALWPIFSFINHGCNDNTSRFSIGDYLFVVAQRDIEQGEEITTLYVPIGMPTLEKQ